MRRPREVFDGGGGWKCTVTSKGAPGTTRSQKRQEGVSPETFGRSMFLLIPYRQTSALQVAGNRFLFFGAIEFVMICYGRTRATGANTVFKR